MSVHADFAMVVRNMIAEGMPGVRHPFRRKVLRAVPRAPIWRCLPCKPIIATYLAHALPAPTIPAVPILRFGGRCSASPPKKSCRPQVVHPHMPN